MAKIGKTLALFLLQILFASQVWAQAQVQVLVDTNQLGIGEPLNLTLRIQSEEDFEIPMPKLPKVDGLEEINSAVGSRQSSSSAQFINGKAQFSTRIIQDYNYLLSPQREGSFIIPSFEVQINGKPYRTQPIKIDVGDQFRQGQARGQKPSGNQPRFPPGFGQEEDPTNPFNGMDDAEDLFEQMLRQQQRMFGGGGLPPNVFPRGGAQPGQRLQNENINIRDNEQFFVYLDVDKTNVYEGEQVTANWYIYTRVGIESLDRVKFPDLKGFWKEIIEEVPSLQFVDVLVNGVPFKKALLASHALFPIKSGTATIDEFKIKAKLRSSAQFGWGKAYEVTKVSKRTEIKVLPLPTEGKTVSFSGAVGQYQISLKTDGTTFPSNQPFSVKIRFDGIGNAKLIELPQIAWPNGLEVYDSKSEAKFFKEGNSYKEFEVLVIPRRQGEMKIPPVELTYFDPKLKKYVTQKTEEIVLQITEGQPLPPGTSVVSGSGAKEKLGEVFNPQPIIEMPSASFSYSKYRWWFYLVITALGMIILGFFSVVQLRALRGGNFAVEEILEKLSKIQAMNPSQDIRKIGSEATNLIYLLVAHLAGKRKADQELHVLIREIPLKDQQTYLERINKLFDYFQLLGFSPDEILRDTMSRTPVSESLVQLRGLTNEIVDKMKKEDKDNK